MRLLSSLQIACDQANIYPRIVIVENETSSLLSGERDKLPLSPELHLHRDIGLTHARNRLFDEVQKKDCDWFIGLDDDEWVSPDWLDQLVLAILNHTNADMFFGPCHYVYDDGLSAFLAPEQFMILPPGSVPEVMTTQNFAIHKSVFCQKTGAGLRFHSSFNETGGEDLEFFLRAQRHHGFNPVWVPSAIVSEERFGARSTLTYRLDRTRRNLLSALRVNRLHHKDFGYGSALRNAVELLSITYGNIIWGTVGSIGGCALVPFNTQQGKLMIGRALRRYARIIAAVQFLFGIFPKAYGASVTPD